MPVEVNQGGETRTVGLRLLDRADPSANRLLVANQFIVQGERDTVRADVVVFVNGLPLALAQLLTRTIRGSMSIDWTRKESVRAKMRIEVRKLLARYGYPPDLQKVAVDLVIQQAETLAAEWG